MTQELNFNQIPIDFKFFSKKSFDNFIVGNNKNLLDALCNLKNTDQIILIYGAKASGKTHLCEATMNIFPDKSHIISNHSSLMNQNLDDYYDLVVIDNLDKLISTKESEEILFSVLNNQMLHNKSAIITSTTVVSKCNIGLKDLSSRLLSDKIFTISDLDDSDKINMMISFCAQRGLEINQKVLEYIMNNCSRDLYFLCALIKNIDSVSLSERRKITIPFIKKVISQQNY